MRTALAIASGTATCAGALLLGYIAVEALRCRAIARGNRRA